MMEPKKPTELMDLPSELLHDIVKLAVGTGADIKMYRSSIGETLTEMVAEHSYGGTHFSTHIALRLVNRCLSEMAGETFYRHNTFEAEDFDVLNKAFEDGLCKFNNHIRSIAIANLIGDIEQAQRYLVQVKNLRRLTFGGVRYVYIPGDVAGWFETGLRKWFQWVLDKTGEPLQMPLRRHRGKRGIKIVFDGNKEGVWDRYEESVRRANLMGKTYIVPLSPEQVKAKVKQLDGEFNEIMVAKENEYLERKLAEAKEDLEEAQSEVDNLVKYMGEPESKRD
ncbi:uncharacterized protein BDZ99DRAFT_470815 [Mytilinidion resinicola]|uniref:Uncharacterized protein n=1 Tax=Mytilinidion resinicola TaxID=574789 RepID=A0A6A6ZA10_9PEZI|nr:uncharacterized protein BDZ99DRAFT_470815 [Mytilinidion resinicola]KAF2817870.1 hypothetical protein BDZ99DRAFT_470815 [Mytilinidion resinicola]